MQRIFRCLINLKNGRADGGVSSTVVKAFAM